MAPIRRYLRFSERGVIEVRVYLDNPALAQSWLLNPRDPALPRILDTVRPVLRDKLREERERSVKGKSKKAKAVKDTVSGDDFEASVFLTDQISPHSILTKSRDISKKRNRIRSNSNKLTSWLHTGTAEKPLDIDAGSDTAIHIREESDEEGGMTLEDYPEATKVGNAEGTSNTREAGPQGAIDVQSDVSEDDGFESKRQSGGLHDTDEKKKLGLQTSYEGFRIFGQVLCLVVKRRGAKSRVTGGPLDHTGQQMLENWVSTQAGQEPQPLEND